MRIKTLIHQAAKNGEINFGIVLTPNRSLNKDYNYVPIEYCFEDFDNIESIIQNFLDKIKELKMNGQPCNPFFIIDDGLGKINWGSKIMEHLLSSYRHYNFEIVYCHTVPEKSQHVVENDEHKCFILSCCR
jgi:hypothetical protein